MNKQLSILGFVIFWCCVQCLHAQTLVLCCRCNDTYETVLNIDITNPCGGCTAICASRSSSVAQCSCPLPLPVEIGEFVLSAQNGAVDLRWSTISELNNAGFEVQRSLDGANWKTLGFIKGNGTTFEVHEYAFKDFRPGPGVNFYRLFVKDFDGMGAFTDILSAKVNAFELNGKFELFPNPAVDGRFTLYAPFATQANSEIQIFTLSGKLVKQESINDLEKTLHFPDLP